MEKIELKKELMKGGIIAHISHYCAGSLYYIFQSPSGRYQFPIPVVESKPEGSVDAHGNPVDSLTLSSDLGTTTFSEREKASMLWRWIDKAIDSGSLITLKSRKNIPWVDMLNEASNIWCDCPEDSEVAEKALENVRRVVREINDELDRKFVEPTLEHMIRLNQEIGDIESHESIDSAEEKWNSWA